MHYKTPYITCFIDKYTVPINHDIDLDSIKIYKRNKDRTLGEMVYNFKIDCNSTPATIFVEDSFGQEKKHLFCELLPKTALFSP